MKRIFAVFCSFLLLLFLAACGNDTQNLSSTEASVSNDQAESGVQTNTGKQIQITTNDETVIVFALNDSTAASDLYDQLPLSVEVENYGSNEKIFYPPEKLNTADAPLAEGPAGTLTYYEPWGNIAIYYGDCGGAAGLYELGDIVSGVNNLSEMIGEIKIDTVRVTSASSETASSERDTAASQQTQPPEAQQSPLSQPTENALSEENTVAKMNVQVGNSTFTATLENNSAVSSFIKMMQKAPVVISMSDYSGFEKVGSLGTSLPASNSQTTTQSGDIVLYGGNQIVVFYGSNSWSYTRLGRIDDLSGWEEALGSGDITITFSVC